MQELTDETIGGDANAVSTISFQIGEKVMNCAGLRGIIVHSHDDITYDIAYNDGRNDCKVQARHIKPVPAGRIIIFILNICLCFYLLTDPPRQNKRPRKWDIIAVAPWTDAGAVDESHVISGKRQRRSVRDNV